MSELPVPHPPAVYSATVEQKSYRSAVPTRDDVLEEILNTEECRHPIVLALVSKDCRERIEFQKGQLIGRPCDLEKFTSAAGGGRTLGPDDHGNPAAADTRESKRLTQTRVVVRYPKDLVVLEMRPGLEKDYRARRYSEALVTGVAAHEERRLSARPPLPPQVPLKESDNKLQALSASDVTHVEHILLLSSDIEDNDPLLRESVDGKKYIAEFRTKGIERGTQPSSIELVYRVVTLTRAPRDCFESQDKTDFWASNLFGDQTLHHGRLPGAKLWYNVPPSFPLVPGVSAFMRVLGFTELGVNDDTSPRNMSLMLTEAEANGDQLAKRVRAAYARQKQCEEQQRMTVAYYEAQARVLAAEKQHLEAKAQDFEIQIAEVHLRTGEQLAAMKRKSEILEVKIEELTNLIDGWIPKKGREESPVSDASTLSHQRSLTQEEEVEAYTPQPG